MRRNNFNKKDPELPQGLSNLPQICIYLNNRVYPY
jgi:hypothetical protein